MKTKSSKQPKPTKSAVRLKDLAAKKNPKAGWAGYVDAVMRPRPSGGGGSCPPFACGSEGNHNETLVRDEQD